MGVAAPAAEAQGWAYRGVCSKGQAQGAPTATSSGSAQRPWVRILALSLSLGLSLSFKVAA